MYFVTCVSLFILQRKYSCLCNASVTGCKRSEWKTLRHRNWESDLSALRNITRKSVEQVTSVDEGALQEDSAATYTAWRYARGTHSTSDVNQSLRSTDWGKTTGESWSRGWGNTPLKEKPWVVRGSWCKNCTLEHYSCIQPAGTRTPELNTSGISARKLVDY